MEPERARELLARERRRIEQALGLHTTGGPLESDTNVEPGDQDDEDLYQAGLDEGREPDLRAAPGRPRGRRGGGPVGARHQGPVDRPRRADPRRAAGGTPDG